MEDLIYISFLVKLKRQKTNGLRWIPGYVLLRHPLSLNQIRELVKEQDPEYQAVAIQGLILEPESNYPGHVLDSLPFITTYT